MLLVVGGAYAGKRKAVKEQFIRGKKFSWISAYQGKNIENWKRQWQKGTTLVLEGWEIWIAEALKVASQNGCVADEECPAGQEVQVETIREGFKLLFHSLIKEEEENGEQVILIMLEMGRGIVPIEAENRRLRDLAGWILQDAAYLSTEVTYIWNGLVKQLK